MYYVRRLLHRRTRGQIATHASNLLSLYAKRDVALRRVLCLRVNSG